LVIDRLTTRGIPTELAQTIAATMEATLSAMEGHRNLIKGRLKICQE